MTNFVNSIYSKKLKFLRQQADATQEAMAERFGMCQQAYSKLEKGKTNFTHKRILQICRVFDISEKDFVLIDDLFFQKDQLVKTQKMPLDDARIEALNRHYEVLLLQSELRNVQLEQKIRNYKPYQETSGKDTPLVYVMI